MALQAWHSLTSDQNVRGLKYSFGPGTANTMAVRLDDGTWMVVSPSSASPADVLDVLANDGGVSALVAPNAFHHMGQVAWRARFPNAVSYAPESGLKRLASKCAAVPFRPIAELVAKLPSAVGIVEPAGMKAPDLFVRATTGADTVWFTGDILSNTTDEDLSPIPRFVMGLFGGTGGYRYNKLPAFIYVKDAPAFKASVAAAVEAAPATVVYPAHGDPVTANVMEQTRLLLA